MPRLVLSMFPNFKSVLCSWYLRDTSLVRLVAISSVLALAPASASAAAFTESLEVREYLQEISEKHELDRQWLDELFAGLEPQQSVIDRISSPAERVLRWWEYRPIFVTDKRVHAGLRFARQHEDILVKVEEKYGVPAEIITAIIGVETYYGRYVGKDAALPALATLAFSYPPRASFFRQELTEFLLLAREERLDPRSMTGSYAAAMGMPQFISSSYRRYAVDFDGDGRRDLWSSPEDVIASVANYFKRHGWRSGEAIAEKVFTRDKSYKTLIKKQLKPELSLEDLARVGISPKGNATGSVSLMSLRLKQGHETWVGFRNFYVITRYNHSRLYAMAVFQLSEALKNAGV